MVGWGHASENPKLGDLLTQKSSELGRDITFVGPQSSVMRILGDKIGANLVAQSAGVSVPPWNGDGLPADLDENNRIPQSNFDAACITTEDEAVEAAERVGYPVMLKASEGGGGKGIRMAEDELALRAAWPQVLNEVPGSPVFLVTLCKGARHLEVQVMSDGENAIALGGRDCSTQRRYQKIFEEGPPIVADNDIFVDMMKAACSLCKTLNYKSAGTVEYLYIPDQKKYYFLELNPRLQVEHPVTEGITGVSLPATQIHVAMGIPLYNVPEVRAFYDEDPNAIGAFNLEYYKPFDKYDKHVIAARITAENPDEGFKPTSGKIDRIAFQSTTKVWGYFSVTADGGVHEFADSQFGHLFASGATREEARKNLVMALKELFIMGEIRTTVEYLGELLETDAFKENTIDTAWLDGILAAKGLSVEVEPVSAVINAAVYRAYNLINDGIRTFQESLSKGQLSTLPLRELQSVPVEITYQDAKYQFVASPKAPDTMVLRIGMQDIEVRYREQADGSLYVAYGDESHQLYAKEEPLGLRMVTLTHTLTLALNLNLNLTHTHTHTHTHTLTPVTLGARRRHRPAAYALRSVRAALRHNRQARPLHCRGRRGCGSWPAVCRSGGDEDDHHDQSDRVGQAEPRAAAGRDHQPRRPARLTYARGPLKGEEDPAVRGRARLLAVRWQQQPDGLPSVPVVAQGARAHHGWLRVRRRACRPEDALLALLSQSSHRRGPRGRLCSRPETARRARHAAAGHLRRDPHPACRW